MKSYIALNFEKSLPQKVYLSVPKELQIDVRYMHRFIFPFEYVGKTVQEHGFISGEII